MLLRKLADALIIFHKGTAEYFDGTYDDFLEKIGWEEEEGTSKPKKPKSKLDRKEYKKQRTALIQARSKEASPHKKELEFCEEKIMELEELLEEHNSALTQASNSGDNSAMIEYSQAIGDTQEKIDVLFERLEAASESLDEITQRYDSKLAELE